MGKNQLIATTEKVCYEVFKLEFALFIPATIFEKLFSKLQLFIMTHNNHNTANISYFTDYQ